MSCPEHLPPGGSARGQTLGTARPQLLTRRPWGEGRPAPLAPAEGAWRGPVHPASVLTLTPPSAPDAGSSLSAGTGTSCAGAGGASLSGGLGPAVSAQHQVHAKAAPAPCERKSVAGCQHGCRDGRGLQAKPCTRGTPGTAAPDAQRPAGTGSKRHTHQEARTGRAGGSRECSGHGAGSPRGAGEGTTLSCPQEALRPGWGALCRVPTTHYVSAFSEH